MLAGEKSLWPWKIAPSPSHYATLECGSGVISCFTLGLHTQIINWLLSSSSKDWDTVGCWGLGGVREDLGPLSFSGRNPWGCRREGTDGIKSRSSASISQAEFIMGKHELEVVSVINPEVQCIIICIDFLPLEGLLNWSRRAHPQGLWFSKFGVGPEKLAFPTAFLGRKAMTN